MNADRIEIDSDEDGFYIYLHTPYSIGSEHRFNIQNCDLDAFYEQVRGRILPYLRERDEALRTRPTVTCADSGAYDLNDPKHSRYHSIHADLYDSREGK